MISLNSPSYILKDFIFLSLSVGLSSEAIDSRLLMTKISSQMLYEAELTYFYCAKVDHFISISWIQFLIYMCTFPANWFISYSPSEQ